MQFTISPMIRFLTFSIVGLIWTGCGKDQKVETKSNLNVAVSVEIASLDPQTTSSIDAIKIQSALFETLVRIDAETGSILPAGALRWEILEDGLKYRFDLNPDLKWSDGTPVTAPDYAFAFRRLMTPELAAPFAPLYYCITGAEQVHQVTGTDPKSIGVEALSEYQLEIHLNRAVPYFLSLLARPCVAALPEKIIVASNAVTSRTAGWSLLSGFPSSGPYQLQEWKVNKHILLRKNEMYPQAQTIEFDTIHFYSIESAYAQEQGFLSGAIDVSSKLASERVQHYENTECFVSQLEMGTFYVITNTESKNLKEVRLRRALSRAIDRAVIVDKLRRRGEQPACAFTPPLWQDYRLSDGFSKNALDTSSAAVEVLNGDNQAEYRGKHLRLLIASSENNLQIAEALQAMWSETLGTEVEIVRQEWKSYLDSRKRGDFELCLATWIGDYFDPLAFLEMWKTGAPNNFSRWHDERFDQLLEQADMEADPDNRFEILARAEGQLMEASPILPIFYLSRVYLKNPLLEKWPQTILNTVDYSKLHRNRTHLDVDLREKEN